jgi:hypothetical protein
MSSGIAGLLYPPKGMYVRLSRIHANISTDLHRPVSDLRATVACRPVAACHTLEKRTLADFVERLELDLRPPPNASGAVARPGCDCRARNLRNIT